MHFYGLVYARSARGFDATRAARLEERAAEFARQFVHWFSADGSALAYGRSQTYRFAQAAFWGALAGVSVAPFTPGCIKGLLLRNLRWWLARPILDDSGLLTIGYAYANALIAETYISPASPYWAFKVFLPLALPEAHPFWQSDEEPMPELPATVCQREPGLIVCRDVAHVFALAAAATVPRQHRFAAEKYAKFCYSSQFAFSVPTARESLASAAHDSMLAFSVDGSHYHPRPASVHTSVGEAALISEWSPMVGIDVTTWLVPAVPWHVRVHRIRTRTRVQVAEGGFALALGQEDAAAVEQGPGANVYARATTRAGTSGIWQLHGNRTASVTASDPNSNIMSPRCVVPTLAGPLPNGEHWLAAAVWASTSIAPIAVAVPPSVRFDGQAFVVRWPDGRELLRVPISAL
jgi:hypothetical protein